ncbi:hypothetical protein Tco_0105016 [Tanacetum coccineum]
MDIGRSLSLDILMKQASATQEEPSEIDTFYRLHTVNGVFQDPEALRMMRELERRVSTHTAEINAMVRGEIASLGHIPGVGSGNARIFLPILCQQI